MIKDNISLSELRDLSEEIAEKGQVVLFAEGETLWAIGSVFDKMEALDAYENRYHIGEKGFNRLGDGDEIYVFYTSGKIKVGVDCNDSEEFTFTDDEGNYAGEGVIL